MTASRQAQGGTGSDRSRNDPNPRLEPLLWLQLLGIGAIAGEALALLVLLGSVDPGPLPGLERLLIWALGALGPAVLLWKRPADPWSLLLLQAPLRGRRDIQRRLLKLQDQPLLRLLPLLAAALLLPVIWRIDQAGGLATGLSPLADSSRLVVLLLSLPLLGVIVWQGQQIGQALWLLSRSASTIQSAEPLSLAEQEQQRLSLGLPLLLLEPLKVTPPAAARQTAAPQEPPKPVPEPSEPATGSADPAPQAPPPAGPPPESAVEGRGPEAEAPQHREAPLPLTVEDAGTNGPPEAQTPTAEPSNGSEIAAAESVRLDDEQRSGAGAIEPEQAAGDGEGSDLNQQVAGLEP